MTSHYRHRRTSNPAIVFTALEPGEVAVNTANRQLAVGDADTAAIGSPLLLLAVRVFDARAQYAVGDFVIYAGNIYRAKTAINFPAAFDPAQWERYADDAATKAYIDANDAAVTDAFTAADASLTMAVSGKVDKAGDTMAGPLTIAALPTANGHVANKQYVDEQIAAGGLVTLPAAQITYLPTGSISSTNVQDAIVELNNEKAPLYSPAFLGVPTTPTPPSPDNSDKIANTAWVQYYTVTYVVDYVASFYTAQAGSSAPLVNGIAGAGTSTKYSHEDHIHPTDTSRAPLASPAFTGIPTAPLPTSANNSDQIATTKWVNTKMAGGAAYAPIADPVFTGNPQAPTPPPGDNDTSLATTAFVQQALAGAGDIAVPVQYLLTSQTITIPVGATKAKVTLQGGGAGSSRDRPSGAGDGTGGATLFKFLSGLVAGKTLALTIGAGGSGAGAGGGPGGNTTLLSGTQTIAALTAGGGPPSGSGGSGTAGGVATGGDINIPGGRVMLGALDTNGKGTTGSGGNSMFGVGGFEYSDSLSGAAVAPTGYGAGGFGRDATGTNGVSGTPGLAIIEWYP